jgi:nitrate/TMAO reductase-like tetraheme cytochrome c subunit
MRISLWLLIVLLIVGAVFGAGGVIASIAFNRYTSTDAFCTSCHSMAFQADDPYFQRSAHRSNNEGMRPSCGDCHIPRTNWFFETYVHVTSGVRDVFVESTTNFNDPKTWEARRVGLEQEALANLRAWDSITCRSCHDASAIHPKSDAGRQSHAALAQGGVTCVDCHDNVVHPPAASASRTDATPANASK